MAESKNQDVLTRLKAGIGNLSKLAPEQTRNFLTFNSGAVKPGVLDNKTKELIAVALAVAARCDGCIAAHVNGAVKAGATPEEIGETLIVAVSMGGGPSLVFATRALEAMEELSKT
jgi:AhpD family alkylhydroperoxidase